MALSLSTQEQAGNRRTVIEQTSMPEGAGDRSANLRWFVEDVQSNLSRTPTILLTPTIPVTLDNLDRPDRMVVSIEREEVIVRLLQQENQPRSFPISQESSSHARSVDTRALAPEFPRLKLLADANTHEDLVALLRASWRGKVADRIDYLQLLVDDDPDQPETDIDSLRGLVTFLVGEKQLPDPQIAIGPAGLVQVEWYIEDNGIVAFEFLPSSFIRFAAIGPPRQPASERIRVNGTLLKDDALNAVQPFISQLSS